MELKYNTKQLTSIEYPGTVLNVDNMAKTLGGENVIFNTFNNPTKRMELRFRPNDPYCKCAHGDRCNTTNLMLKVTKRTKSGSSPGEEQYDLSVEILGVVPLTYKFKAMSDFHLLPVTYDGETKTRKSLLNDLLPTTLHDTSWLDRPVELFMPPVMFSRFDLPQPPYADSLNKKTEEGSNKLPPNIIGRCRKRRSGHAVLLLYENTEEDVIMSPKPEALQRLNRFPLDTTIVQKMGPLFQERPIWSRNGLLCELKCDRNKLKNTLPCVAYYFNNGPWRTLWTRFKYDPRKEPSSKIYQVMDLRIPPSIPFITPRTKRSQSYYTLPNKSTVYAQPRTATINTQDFVSGPKESTEDNDPEEDDTFKLLLHQYFPGKLPAARQVFYQLVDIHLDAVQKLVHQNDGKEEFCTERDGWLPPGTIEACREIVMNDISKTISELTAAKD